MAVSLPHINIILRTLCADDVALLDPYLESVELPLRHALERPSVPIEHVYFLTSGLASIVASSGRDMRVEVGLFGLEGMSGSAIVLGNGTSPNECFMQIGGAGIRIGSDRLNEAMNQSLTLHRNSCVLRVPSRPRPHRPPWRTHGRFWKSGFAVGS